MAEGRYFSYLIRGNREFFSGFSLFYLILGTKNTSPAACCNEKTGIGLSEMLKLYRQPTFRATLLILAYSLLFYFLAQAASKLFFAVDFTEYWSASKLTLSGQNPYSAEAIWSIESQVPGWYLDHPVMMYNPPWVLGMILPFGLLPIGLGTVIWLILSVVAIVIASVLCWQLYGGSPKKRWLAILLGISFVPGLICFKAGQITPFVLLGVAGFLYGISRERWGLAGASIYLISLKPNLIFLFWPAFVLWFLKEKKWAIIRTAILCGLVFLAIPMIFNPRVLVQYREVGDIISPLYWQTHTLAAGLRLLFGVHHYWLQFLPAALACAWFVYYWKRYSRNWQWLERMPALLLVSLTLAFSAWDYDQLLLLPVLMQVAVWFMRKPRRFSVPAILYWAANGLLFGLVVAQVDPFLTFWFSPALLLIYLLGVSLKNGLISQSLEKTSATISPLKKV